MLRSYVIPALQVLLLFALGGGSWAQAERPNLILALEYETGFIGHNWMLTIDRSGVIQQHILTTKERFWLRQLSRTQLRNVQELLRDSRFLELTDLPPISEDAPTLSIVAEVDGREHRVTMSDPCGRQNLHSVGRFMGIWNTVVTLAEPLKEPRRDPLAMEDGRCAKVPPGA